MHRRTTVLALTAALALGAGACSATSSTSSTGTTAPPATTRSATAGDPMPGSTMAPAADALASAAGLRTSLTLLLNEHVILASQATGAALAGRQADFEASAAQLDHNSDAIAEAIGVVYGDGAGKAFGSLWKKHIGFLVDYTKALGAGDQAAADVAVGKLVAYADEFAAFLSSANPALDKATVSGLVKDHILTLKDVVDAQAAKDPATVYPAISAAVGHMHAIADPLVAAIAGQFPDRFPGDPASKAADLQVALNSVLQQHVAYAAFATDAALGGRAEEFEAAKALLADNTGQLADAVGSVFGESAGTAFQASWEKHIGFFVAYATAVGAGDESGRAEAAKNLDAYADELASFFSAALPDLPKATVAEIVRGHIVGLESVIDAQGAGDRPLVEERLAEAMGHMRSLADPLAAAIVAEKGDRLGG